MQGVTPDHINNKMKGVLYSSIPPTIPPHIIELNKQESRTKIIERTKEKGKDIDVVIDPYLMEDARKKNPDSN